MLIAAGCGGSSSDENTSSTSAAKASSDSSSTTSSGGGGSDATCGVHKVDGVQARTFCGDGTMKVSAKSVDMTFPAGSTSCETGDDYVAVNSGTILLGQPKGGAARPDYVGVVIGATPAGAAPGAKPAPKDGTYDHVTAGGSVLGQDFAVMNNTPVTATLKNNRTAGTVTGQGIDKQPITIEFTCG